MRTLEDLRAMSTRELADDMRRYLTSVARRGGTVGSVNVDLVLAERVADLQESLRDALSRIAELEARL